MLPLVLGGIALAAVGYGVKEFCESEGCPWDEASSSTRTKKKNVFKKLHKRKMTIYDTNFKTLKEHLSQIKNLKELPLDIEEKAPTKEKLDHSDVTGEVKVYVEQYIDILRDANSVLVIYVKKVEEIMHTSLDYREYSKKDKKFLKKLYRFMKEMQDVLSLKLLDDNNTMCVDSIVSLREYREIVRKRYEKSIPETNLGVLFG